MSSRYGRLARVLRITLKELRETLRDRRTILTLVLMPALTYPLLGTVLQKFLLSQAPTSAASSEYRIAFTDEPLLQEVQSLFVAVKSQRDETADGDANPAHMQLFVPTREADEASAETGDSAAATEAWLEQLIATRMIDVGVLRNGGPQTGAAFTGEVDQEQGGADRRATPRYEILYSDQLQNSHRAFQWIDGRFRAANELAALAAFRQLNLPQRLPGERTVREILVRTSPGVSLAALIPMMLILMTVTGAVYPAIDLTAGERERGTLETLISAPIPRMTVLLAKYVAVFVVAMLTATVNLAAMFVTVLSIGLDKVLFGEAGLPPVILLQIFGLQIVFAAFFSAVLLTITSLARSFKEAQAYLIPLMLVSLAPGIASLIPGVELTFLTAVVPLFNLVLLAKSVFEQAVSWPLAGVVILMTTLYTAVALGAASKVFGADAVSLGSSESWGSLLRRPVEVASDPSLFAGLASLGLITPSFIVVSGLHAHSAKLGIAGSLVFSSLITITLFAIVPLVFLVWERVRAAPALGLVVPSAWGWAAAVCLGLSLWPFAFELEQLVLPAERVKALVELFKPIQEQLLEVPLALKLFSLALVPAVCEELFFRGYLLGALRKHLPAAGVVIATATAFGLFHILVRDSLFFERFIPTAALGLVLAIVRLQTGSLLPGIVMHVLHNSSVLLVAHFEPQLKAMGIGAEVGTHLPGSWLAGALVVVALGAFSLRQCHPNAKPTKVPMVMAREV